MMNAWMAIGWAGDLALERGGGNNCIKKHCMRWHGIYIAFDDATRIWTRY